MTPADPTEVEMLTSLLDDVPTEMLQQLWTLALAHLGERGLPMQALDTLDEDTLHRINRWGRALLRLLPADAPLLCQDMLVALAPVLNARLSKEGVSEDVPSR